MYQLFVDISRCKLLIFFSSVIIFQFRLQQFGVACFWMFHFVALSVFMFSDYLSNVFVTVCWLS